MPRMTDIRVGLVWDGRSSPVDVARRAEAAGYAALRFPDHTGMLAPLPAMVAAAGATSRLALGTQVVNVTFRALGTLAQELAAVDVLSEGRLHVGLGAGAAPGETLSVGLPFPPAHERVAAVGRALEVLPRLFGGETVTEDPGPGRLTGYRLDPLPPQGSGVPFMVGGDGDRLLALAARHADVCQLTGFAHRADGTDYRHFGPDGLADRVAHVRAAAGDRFADLRLSVLIQIAAVVPDPPAHVAAVLDGGPAPLTLDQWLESPFTLVGRSVAEVRDKALWLRDRYGVTDIAVFDGRSVAFDDVVADLSGR
jgi:probable F420-dependent oxidoreductase